MLPHQRERHLVIKPRYPTVPWQLDGARLTAVLNREVEFDEQGEPLQDAA